MNRKETGHPNSKMPYKLKINTVLLIFTYLLSAFLCIADQGSHEAKASFRADAATASYQADRNLIDNEEITPATWRRINLEMIKADGSTAEIDLLRPLWWLSRAEARVGGAIYLSMPEIGIEGNAKVLKIGPCNADSRGKDPLYRVVTGKFVHENAVVQDLYFNNGIDKPLGVTPHHPLWSVTRNGWVQAGKLQIGEYVKTKQGVAQLALRRQREGRYKVYNIEVHKNHTYYVSGLGILAHNACEIPIKRPKKKPNDGPKKIASVISKRKEVAESFYREAGFKDSAIADHTRGIDFDHPVEVVTLPKGTEVIQYQIPGAPVGNYFAPPGTKGNQLGFYTSGRRATTFVAKEDIKVLKSVASDTVDDWSMKAYDWKIEAPGGGTQFFTTSKAWTPVK